MTNEHIKFLQLATNIKNARKQKGFSQNKLAELLDISREHLAKVETAKKGISLSLLFKLSEIVGVPESKLLKFEIDKNN